MSLFKKIKLVTFDVTNTLLKFRRSQGEQYGEIGAMFGVLRDNNQLYENFKSNWWRMNQQHPNFGLNEPDMGWRNWWRALIRETFLDSLSLDPHAPGMTVNEKKLEHIADHLIDAYQTSACWQQCYGSGEILQYLSDNKITMGVVSNFDPRLPELLKNMKIKDHFSFVMCSYEAKAQKPDEEIFNKALEEGQKIIPNLQPSEVLHIGDTGLLDYKGARDAGWNAILIHERDPELLAKKYKFLDPNTSTEVSTISIGILLMIL
ncbi:rhythmically expressed gene 2 protein-like [Ctenocephalides felis]|uniref:rhythmically expressed gene 2 protein-like n=1 Tax=Ctenocephalides felis TaxID=7515 RepID=UPI000E6E5A44|nr:rhythmically expressed gene 2 protein-like [Ctenocephalides felis]